MRPTGGGRPDAIATSAHAAAKVTPDGFVSIGDLGWVDADGYLYIADRRTDLIISGGANVYPAEVEAALSEHPGIGGLRRHRHARRGMGHAASTPSSSRSTRPIHRTSPALDRHCRERIASYKVPKTWEFVAELPRNEAGKIRRSALRP